MLVVATYAGAAGAAPPTTAQEVVAWANRTLSDVDDLPVLGFNHLGLTLGSPRGASVRSNGLVEGEIRQEFFEPVELDGYIMRSATGRWTVDCVRQRYAVLQMTLFARNNLVGQLSERETEPPVWLPRDRVSEYAIEAMCAAARRGLPPGAP